MNNSDILVSIFTPTYNRAKYLIVLYQSLLTQTYSNFEWIIVDDGSTDETETLIKNLSVEQKIKIIYRRQPNSGKHIAINNGVLLAKGKLFYVVDSDDFLPASSLERIIHHWQEVEKSPLNERKSTIGIAGNITYPTGEVVGGNPMYDVITTDLIDYRFSRRVRGDKAEVYLTDVVRQNPFPIIDQESFCPEALVFYRLADKGLKLRFFNENIYVCDYLVGGLSLNGLKTIQRGPIASLQSYADVMGFTRVPLVTKFKYAVLFWRISYLSKRQSFSEILSMLRNKVYLIAYPFGLLFHLKDRLQKKL